MNIKEFKKSCDLGDAKACYQLGNFYKLGIMGVEENESKAQEYYEKACKLDHEISCKKAIKSTEHIGMRENPIKNPVEEPILVPSGDGKVDYIIKIIGIIIFTYILGQMIC